MTTEKVVLRTVTLGAAGLTGLTGLTDKLNKRAERHGMEKVEVRVVSTFGFVPVFRKGFGVSTTLYNVEIIGCAPRIDGWALACRVEFNDIIGQVVRIAPGRDDDGSYTSYRTIAPVCEHCNTERRRNDVFVLEHSDGRRKIVGRNCLADFLRTGDADSFALYAEYCDRVAEWGEADFAGSADEEGFGWGGRISPVAPLDRFLTIVSMLTRKLGWTSRTEARDDPSRTATAADAGYYLYGKGKHHREWIEKNELYPESGDAELADKAIAWVNSLESSPSEYIDTIRKIGKAGLVDRSIDGYAASIVRAYQKDCDRNNEKRVERKVKEFIGKPGERMRGLRVRVVRVRYYEGDFGTKTIVAMEADLPNGAIAPITWFASGSLEFTEGAEYDLTATVKKKDGHTDDARYGKQTIVQRAELEELVAS